MTTDERTLQESPSITVTLVYGPSVAFKRDDVTADRNWPNGTDLDLFAAIFDAVLPAVDQVFAGYEFGRRIVRLTTFFVAGGVGQRGRAAVGLERGA